MAVVKVVVALPLHLQGMGKMECQTLVAEEEVLQTAPVLRLLLVAQAALASSSSATLQANPHRSQRQETHRFHSLTDTRFTLGRPLAQ